MQDSTKRELKIGDIVACSLWGRITLAVVDSFTPKRAYVKCNRTTYQFLVNPADLLRVGDGVLQDLEDEKEIAFLLKARYEAIEAQNAIHNK